MGDDVLVSLLEEARPVADAAHQAPDVDKVKVGLRVRPVELGIVDFEPDVGGYPAGLDRGEIGANDCGSGELVGKVTAKVGSVSNSGRMKG